MLAACGYHRNVKDEINGPSISSAKGSRDRARGGRSRDVFACSPCPHLGRGAHPDSSRDPGRTFSPRDRLPSESEMVNQFGVSRISLRDALRTLEAMGLVEIKVGAQGGAFVSQPGTQYRQRSAGHTVSTLGRHVPGDCRGAPGAGDHSRTSGLRARQRSRPCRASRCATPGRGRVYRGDEPEFSRQGG